MTLDGVISKHLMRSLLATLQQRDLDTIRHSRRVAILASGLAQHLGWESRSLRVLEVAALLHDVGKIGVPDHILFKPGKLNNEELDLMSLQYDVGLCVLQACHLDPQVLQIVAQAQGRHNGNDQTMRSLGNDVHQGARILAIADAYESLSTEKPFRPAFEHEEIMKILNEGAGTSFDGNMVLAFDRWAQSSGVRINELGMNFEEPHATGATSSEELYEIETLTLIFSQLYGLENLYDGFLLLNSRLEFAVWNCGAARLFGRRPEQVLGATWNPSVLGYSEVEGCTLSEEACPTMKAKQSGKPVTTTLFLTGEKGIPRQVEIQSIPLFDESGEFYGVAEMFRDVHREKQQRSSEFAELRLAATRDPLTSLANRAEMENQLQTLVKNYAEANSDQFSVIFIDADHFKSINDTYGHGVGDQVLIDLARLLQHETYSGELVGRYGGEEFVVICPGTDLMHAYRRAERLRSAVQKATFAGMPSMKVSASFGVSESEPGETVESILNRADSALYKAKESGRNRTCTMTKMELAAQNEAERDEAKPPATLNPFEITVKMSVVVAANMLIYKLGGFVNDADAKILDVGQRHLHLKIGKPTLFGGWGKQAKNQPVRVEVTYEQTDPNDRRKLKRDEQRHPFHVTVTPLVNVSNAKSFRDRAMAIIHELRDYLAADLHYEQAEGKA